MTTLTKDIPQIPLSWCEFEHHASAFCAGVIHAFDPNNGLLFDVDECKILVKPGMYSLGFYYKACAANEKKKIIGFAAIHEDHLNQLEEKNLNNPFVYGNQSFSVDSGKVCFVTDLEQLRENKYELLDNEEGFKDWGWLGSTLYGDGGYGLEPVITQEGEIVGALLSLSEVSEQDYWEMVEENFIEHDEEFYQNFFS